MHRSATRNAEAVARPLLAIPHGLLLPALALVLVCCLAPASAQSEAPPPVRAQAWYDFGGGGSYLGVYLEELSDAMRTALGLDEESGILVERVADGGPAERAGMEAGDVLLQLGGKRTDSSSNLSRVLDRFDPGEEVEAVVWRKGDRKKLTVTLGRRRGFAYTDGALAPVPEVEVTPEIPANPFGRLGFCCGLQGLGIRSEDLTGQLAEFFQVQRGVLVTWVSRETPAEKGGVKAGDVIVGVQGQPVQNRSDLEQTLSEFSGSKEMELDVVRRGEKKTLSLSP